MKRKRIFKIYKKNNRFVVVPYEIKVYTSNISGAGTDANVHIEIYGQDKTTGEVMLCGKTDRKGKFQTGSIDTFVLELEDIGNEIEKIRIGHDNHGFGKIEICFFFFIG